MGFDGTDSPASVRLARWLAFDDPEPLPAIEDDTDRARQTWIEAIAIGLASGLLPTLAARYATDAALSDPRSLTAGQLRTLVAGYRYRHASQTQQLTEIVSTLNARGIEPMLSGQTRMLWSGLAPNSVGREQIVWVARKDRPGSTAILQRLGYRTAGLIDGLQVPGATAWMRSETCGWILLCPLENSPTRGAWPTDDLRRATYLAPRDSARAHVLPALADTCFCLLAEAAGQRWSSQPSVRMSTLFDFAAAFRSAPGPTLPTLKESAQLDAWADVARTVFGASAAAPKLFADADVFPGRDAYRVTLRRSVAIIERFLPSLRRRQVPDRR